MPVLLLKVNAECRKQDAELNIELLDFASVHHARDARTHTRNRARIIILTIQPFFGVGKEKDRKKEYSL